MYHTVYHLIPSFSCWPDYDYSSDLECGKVCQVICYANIHVPMTCVHMYIVAVQICRLLVLCASEWNMYVQVRHLFLLCQNITPSPPSQHLSIHVYLNTTTILLVKTHKGPERFVLYTSIALAIFTLIASHIRSPWPLEVWLPCHFE